jgi:hypothetical protein
MLTIQFEVRCRIALDPVVAHGHLEHAMHVAQCIVGDRGRAGRDDASQSLVDVPRLHVSRCECAEDWIDMPAQHTLDDLRVLVPRLDVPVEPKLAEPSNGASFESERLRGLLGRGNVNAALDLRTVATRKLARFLQRQLRISAEYLFLRPAVQPEPKDPGRLARSRRGLARDEGQPFADAFVGGAHREQRFQLAVGDRSMSCVWPVHPIAP